MPAARTALRTVIECVSSVTSGDLPTQRQVFEGGAMEAERDREEERLQRLRERIGTSSRARKRQEVYEQHVSGNSVLRDAAHFRDSFSDLNKKLRTIGPLFSEGDSFFPGHMPTLVDSAQHVYGPDNYDFAVGQADDDSGVSIGVSADR